MSHPALEYAEVQLGVHKIFEEAKELEDQLDRTYTALDKAQDERRDLDEKIADYEMQLLVAERGKHADMSATAMDQHMRVVKQRDEGLRKLRMERNMKSGFITGYELDADHIKQKIRIRSARMEELGGYFHYLAVTKQAAVEAEKSNQTTTQENQ